eukprot:TRINITY_DN4116_c0_g1_i4.p2 TRINITY_DN4116_c0_g1~~TRINITY_DN4116_c0_g1_i4.p2  ORF type:complete len:160 (+),score=1.36 TRINITY_DN4116_c0_g1_i4:710-1189(+)
MMLEKLQVPAHPYFLYFNPSLPQTKYNYPFSLIKQTKTNSSILTQKKQFWCALPSEFEKLQNPLYAFTSKKFHVSLQLLYHLFEILQNLTSVWRPCNSPNHNTSTSQEKKGIPERDWCLETIDKNQKTEKRSQILLNDLFINGSKILTFVVKHQTNMEF